MLGFVRSAWRLCCAFACLVSLPADGPARLRTFGDGGGCVVRVASHTSQEDGTTSERELTSIPGVPLVETVLNGLLVVAPTKTSARSKKSLLLA